MSTQAKSRRAFLVESLSGVGAAWVTANYTGILATHEYVLQAAQSGQPVKFAFLTPEQGAEVEAMTAQIIPTDSTPGAREARVVQFIDRALVTFEKGRQSAYTQGLKDLQTKTKELFPAASMFSALTPDQQIQVLKASEETPFFNLVRTHTITGFFASPAHGGNYSKVGWKLVSYDDSLNFKPPFGYYDALPEFRG
jgi:gluconate 2-dehydrogenase gamma chain